VNGGRRRRNGVAKIVIEMARRNLKNISYELAEAGGRKA